MKRSRQDRSHTQLKREESDESTAIDIEECVQSRRLFHNSSYHRVRSQERTLIQTELLAWYDEHKRTNMPWRKPTNTTVDKEALGQRAYEVWVSEIMLQQTQVATVIDYYQRWMTAFPTIYDLAKADIEQVNTLWAGLGYYSRARRLWEGANKVVAEFGGILPGDAKDLQQHIPGVGRYTAGAVASIVYGQQVPVVDGNVIRVLSRLRAINADPKKAHVTELFWEIAADLVPGDRPGDFNQAMMELGARVCVPKNPSCQECPLKHQCLAHQQEETYKRLKENNFWTDVQERKRKITTEHECDICPEITADLISSDYQVTRYPAKSDKKPPRDEECAVCIIQCNQKENQPMFIISKRPETGLLAGLWEFPSLELDLNTTYEERVAKTTAYLASQYGIDLSSVRELQRHDLGSVVHLFSHIRKVYHIEWLSYQQSPSSPCAATNTATETRWVSLEELRTAAIPTGLKKALKLLEKFQKTGSGINKKQSSGKDKTSTPSKKKATQADISMFFKKSVQS